LSGTRARGADYYWNGGSGNWDTSTKNWQKDSPSGPASRWKNLPGDIAQIGDIGTAGAISLTTAINAETINVSAAGYTLQTNGSTQTLSGNIVLASGAALNLNSAASAGDQTLVIAGNISGGAGVSLQGGTAAGSASIVNLAMAGAAVSSPISINLSGTGVGGVVASASGVQISGAITNNSAGATLIGANGAGTLTLTSTAAISGSQGVRFAAGDSGGTGTVTLNSQSIYSGATVLNMASTGVVKLGVGNALPTGSNVTIGAASGFGGTLDLNGFNQEIASLTSAAGAVGEIRNNATGTTSTLTVSSSSPGAFGLARSPTATGQSRWSRAGRER